MLVLAATNIGTRQSVSLSVCLSVSCHQRAAASRQGGLCDSTDVISGLLAEFDQRFQERRILNHSLHYLPLCLLLMQNMFPKKSRWRYSICSATPFRGSFFHKKISEISLCCCRNMAMFGSMYMFVNSSSHQGTE